MNEGVLELPLLWLEESYGMTLLAAFVAAVTAASAAWRHWARRFTGAAAPTHWLIEFARGVIAAHDRFYNAIAGVHPHRRIWHCQWLSVKDLYRDLRQRLPAFTGRVVDVGCLGKPYSIWLTNAEVHFGLDVTPGPSVDLVIREGEAWAIGDECFDAGICALVLQVAENPAHLIDELGRILVPGGIAIISAPFAYHDMTYTVGTRVYEDYWRHSFHGLQKALGERFELVECWRQGGFGSVTGSMFLNWIRMSMTRRLDTHLLFVVLLPVWLPFCFLVNIAGWLVDKTDRTGAFYHNAAVLVRKRSRVTR